MYRIILLTLILFSSLFVASAQDDIRQLDLVGTGTEFVASPNGSIIVVFTNHILLNYQDMPTEEMRGIQVYDVEAKQLLYDIVDVTDFTQGVAFSSDGSRFVTHHLNGTINIWESATGTLINTLYGTQNGSSLNYFLDEGQTLLTLASGFIPSFLWWDIDTGTIQSILTHRFDSFGQMRLEMNDMQITGTSQFTNTVFDITPDETQMVTATISGNVWLWDLSQPNENPELLIEGEELPNFPISRLHILPDGEHVVLFYNGLNDADLNGLYRLNLQTGDLELLTDEYDMQIFTLSPDGLYIIWGDPRTSEIFIAPLSDLTSINTLDLAIEDYRSQFWRDANMPGSLQVANNSQTLFVGGFTNSDLESDFIYVVNLE